MLGQFTRQKETDCSLDLPAGDGGALVVVGQSGSLSRDSLEDIVDKGVHDRHGLAADASVGVHLLQHLVDVDGIAFLPLALALLVAGANSLCLAGLLGALGANFGRHDVVFTGSVVNVCEMRLDSKMGFNVLFRHSLCRTVFLLQLFRGPRCD